MDGRGRIVLGLLEVPDHVARLPIASSVRVRACAG